MKSRLQRRIRKSLMQPRLARIARERRTKTLLMIRIRMQPCLALTLHMKRSSRRKNKTWYRLRKKPSFH